MTTRKLDDISMLGLEIIKSGHDIPIAATLDGVPISVSHAISLCETFKCMQPWEEDGQIKFRAAHGKEHTFVREILEEEILWRLQEHLDKTSDRELVSV